MVAGVVVVLGVVVLGVGVLVLGVLTSLYRVGVGSEGELYVDS